MEKNVVPEQTPLSVMSDLGLHCLLRFYIQILRVEMAMRLISRKHAFCNFDPLKPNFYIVELWFTVYTLVFLFLLKNIDCEYSLDPPRRGGSNTCKESIF